MEKIKFADIKECGLQESEGVHGGFEVNFAGRVELDWIIRKVGIIYFSTIEIFRTASTWVSEKLTVRY